MNYTDQIEVIKDLSLDEGQSMNGLPFLYA